MDYTGGTCEYFAVSKKGYKLDGCRVSSTQVDSLKFEVDFTIGDSVAIEVKAKSRVTEPDLKGLRALKEEGIFKRLICVSDETSSRTTDDGIEIIPIQEFLRALWTEEVITGA